MQYCGLDVSIALRLRRIALPLLLIGASAIPAVPQEVRHEGRTLSEWQGELHATSPQVRAKAARALALFGEQAVPLLAWVLTDDMNAGVRLAAAASLRVIGPPAKDAVAALTGALRDPSDLVRAAAVDALGTIGPAAKTAVPALIQLLGASLADWLVAHSSMCALRAIGPEAVPELRRAVVGDARVATTPELGTALRRIIEEIAGDEIR